jgi:hypothetical protein
MLDHVVFEEVQGVPVERVGTKHRFHMIEEPDPPSQAFDVQHSVPRQAKKISFLTFFHVETGLVWPGSVNMTATPTMRIEDPHWVHDELHFTLCGATDAFANMLKGALITRVPIPAVTSVTIRRNTSLFSDDMIAHRMGMIPLTGWDSMGVEGVSATLELSVKANHTQLRVTSAMLRSEMHKNVKPVHSDDVVAILNPGEELSLVGHVEMGTGAAHARWNPVVAPTYRKLAHIEVDRNYLPTSPEKLKEIARSCSQPVFSDNMEVLNPSLYDFTGDCIKVAPPNAIHVKEVEHVHRFSFGVTGAVDHVSLLRQALLALSRRTAGLPDKFTLAEGDIFHC